MLFTSDGQSVPLTVVIVEKVKVAYQSKIYNIPICSLLLLRDTLPLHTVYILQEKFN